MRKFRFPQGSIMIWTLLMGISLTVVFFFFSQRLNAGVASQRATMEYQNARLLAESYADYLENLTLAELKTIKTAGGTIDFEGIKGTLTNDADAITGSVDAGMESIQYHFTDTVKIQWNLCSQNFESDLIVINGASPLFPHVVPPPPNCGPSTQGYDDETTLAVINPFSLKSNGVPFYYSISSTTPDKSVPSNEWQLKLEIPLGLRKKVTVNRTFVKL